MLRVKIAFLHGPHDLRIEEVSLPEPTPDQILIKLKAAGICGSDVECFEGHSKEGRYDLGPRGFGRGWHGGLPH
jgi:L-iditol 2-dehydrogenase